MNKIIGVLIFLSVYGYLSSAHAEGPMYKNKDSVTQMEFDNAYADLRSKVPTSLLTTNTSGQFLTGQGNGINPIWGPVPNTGRILQIVPGVAITASTTTTVTNAFVRSGISVGITPVFGSTICVGGYLANFKNTTAGDDIYATLERNGTNLANASGNDMLRDGISATVSHPGAVSIFVCDSPNSSATLTYEIYFKADAGTASICGGSNGAGSGECRLFAIEIGK